MLDDEAAAYLDRMADRLGMPKSWVVREALRVYGEQLGRLTDAERDEALAAFDRAIADVPARPRREVEAELERLREARRKGGRRSLIVLDTCVLVEALGAGGSMRVSFRRAIAEGNRIVLPTLVLYEWLRGPRVPEELAVQEAVVPAADAIPFGAEEAGIAADLYKQLKRSRGRELDLAIAACAIS